MTAIRLEPVTVDTYEAVLRLRVGEEQRTFVAPNVRSLADAWAYPRARPLAVLAGPELVGFALLHPVEGDDDALGLVRFMIDRRFQRRGLGRLAALALVDLATAEGYARLRLSVEPENTGARALYEGCGFRATGETEDGEDVMLRALGPQ